MITFFFGFQELIVVDETYEDEDELVHKAKVTRAFEDKDEAFNVWTRASREFLLSWPYDKSSPLVDRLINWMQDRTGLHAPATAETISQFLGAFDSTRKSGGLEFSISIADFLKFWNWFEGTCEIVGDIGHLWTKRYFVGHGFAETEDIQRKLSV